MSLDNLPPAIFFALCSVALILFGVHLVRGEHAFRRRALMVPATIVAEVTGTTEDTGGNDENVFRPKVQFTGPDGKTVEQVGRDGDSSPSWHVGQLVHLRWDPKPPHRFEIIEYDHTWPWDLFVLVLGLLFAGAAVGTMFM